MEFLFGYVVWAFFWGFEEGVADIVEHEFGVQGAFYLDTVDSQRRISLDTRILQRLQILPKYRIILIIIKRLRKLIRQHIRLGPKLALIQTLRITLLQLRNPPTLAANTFHIAPPLVRMFLIHNLLPNLLIQQHLSIGRIQVIVADCTVLAVVVAILGWAHCAVYYVVD